VCTCLLRTALNGTRELRAAFERVPQNRFTCAATHVGAADASKRLRSRDGYYTLCVRAARTIVNKKVIYCSHCALAAQLIYGPWNSMGKMRVFLLGQKLPFSAEFRCYVTILFCIVSVLKAHLFRSNQKRFRCIE